MKTELEGNENKIVQLSVESRSFDFQRLFDVYDTSIDITTKYNLSGFQYSAYDVLQIFKDVKLLDGFDPTKKIQTIAN